MLCFKKNVNANLTIRRKKWCKLLAGLGKKLSKDSEIAQLCAQRVVNAVPTPTRTGPAPSFGSALCGGQRSVVSVAGLPAWVVHIPVHIPRGLTGT
jgi:hypothetical protein